MKYNLRVLTAIIASLTPPDNFIWSMAIGDSKPETKKEMELQTMAGSRMITPLVGRREEGKLVSKRQWKKETFEPSGIKCHIPLSAEDLLEQQFGQTQYAEPASVQDTRLKNNLIYLKEVGARTRYWCLSQFLKTGVYPTDEGQTGIQFGDLDEETLSGTAQWKDPDADILGYLKAKRLNIQKNTGLVVDTLIITPEQSSYFQENNRIKEILKRPVNQTMALAPKILSQGATYICHIAEINTAVYSSIDWVQREQDGVVERMLEENEALYIKKGSFHARFAPAALKEKPNDPNSPQLIYVGEEIVRKTSKGDDDQLEYISYPVVIPENSEGWAKIITHTI